MVVWCQLTSSSVVCPCQNFCLWTLMISVKCNRLNECSTLKGTCISLNTGCENTFCLFILCKFYTSIWCFIQWIDKYGLLCSLVFLAFHQKFSFYRTSIANLLWRWQVIVLVISQIALVNRKRKLGLRALLITQVYSIFQFAQILMFLYNKCFVWNLLIVLGDSLKSRDDVCCLNLLNFIGITSYWNMGIPWSL